MAIPPVGSEGGDGTWLWQSFMAMGSGVVAGLSAAHLRMSGLGSRVAVVESELRTNRDAFKALAESHRVAEEKRQEQYWELRNKIEQVRSEMGQLVTATHFQKSHDELLEALREIR